MSDRVQNNDGYTEDADDMHTAPWIAREMITMTWCFRFNQFTGISCDDSVISFYYEHRSSKFVDLLQCSPYVRNQADERDVT